MESLEAGVPMLVFPISVYDQFMFCYYIQDRGLGACIRNNNHRYILGQLQQIEQSNFFKENMYAMQQVIKEGR